VTADLREHLLERWQVLRLWKIKEARQEVAMEGRQFFLIKSRKDDICDFLLLISWLFCAMKEPGVQV